MFRELEMDLEIKDKAYDKAAKALSHARYGLGQLEEIHTEAQRIRNLAYFDYNEYRREQAQEELTTEEILGPWTFHAATTQFGGDELCCLVYKDSYYIEIHEDEYYLMLECEYWVSQSLKELEARLAEFVLLCGDDPYVAEYRGWDYR